MVKINIVDITGTKEIGKICGSYSMSYIGISKQNSNCPA